LSRLFILFIRPTDVNKAIGDNERENFQIRNNLPAIYFIFKLGRIEG